MRKKNLECKECGCCIFYNPECRQGACSIYPYKKKKIVSEKKEHDTG